MAKQIRSQAPVGSGSKPVRAEGTPKPKQSINGTSPIEGTTGSQLKFHLLAIAGIAIVTFLVLKVCLLNQFTNWDDPGYVTNQPIIKDISGEGIRNIFALSSSIMGNYHPITILTYAIDYSISGLAPYSFHLQSLLFHVLTTILVYCFVQLLTGRMIAAVITALLFGLHPMHVESVAWVAGRKDVVYGAFFIASCISYLYYIRKGGSQKWIWYAGSLVMFGCSILSKPVAVSLPITLLVIDLLEGRFWANIGLVTEGTAGEEIRKRLFNFNILVEKIPFFAIAILCGLKSIRDQDKFGALGTQGEHFNFIERIGLGGYALFTYLWKAVAPSKLLCYYPYPLKENGHLPFVYFVYPAIVAVLGAVIWWYFRKQKYLVFGFLFFLVNIALLLQFIPVGGAIIADRYSYIPYLGLFLALGWWVADLWQNKATKQLGEIAMAFVLVYCGILAYLSNERCKVWYDGMSLWRNEIETEPVRAPNGYNNLGFFYFTKFNNALTPAERKVDYDSAYYLLNKAIELQEAFANPYVSLGELFRANNQFDEAKKMYYKALKLDVKDQVANAYLGLAIVYSITRNDDSAMFSYMKTLELKPYNPEAHSNYANFLDMTGKKDDALKQYTIAMEQNPDIVAPYLNRGRALQRMNRCEEAFKDFATAMAISPDMGELYYARSVCYAQKGNKAQALQDVEKARSLGFNNIDNNYYMSLKQ